MGSPARRCGHTATTARTDRVKEEMFRTKIEPRYEVAGVIDDRDRLVKMWRRIGLVCLQVAEDNF